MKVRVGSHRNVIIDREYFTSYELIIDRNDGSSWKVKVRYSEVAQIRD